MDFLRQLGIEKVNSGACSVPAAGVDGRRDLLASVNRRRVRRSQRWPRRPRRITTP